MCLADNTLELGDWNLPKLYIKIYILSFRVTVPELFVEGTKIIGNTLYLFTCRHGVTSQKIRIAISRCENLRFRKNCVYWYREIYLNFGKLLAGFGCSP